MERNFSTLLSIEQAAYKNASKMQTREPTKRIIFCQVYTLGYGVVLSDLTRDKNPTRTHYFYHHVHQYQVIVSLQLTCKYSYTLTF